jgi:hypothetical protein
MSSTEDILKNIENKIVRCDKCNSEYITSTKGCPVCNENRNSVRTVYNSGGKKVG